MQNTRPDPNVLQWFGVVSISKDLSFFYQTQDILEKEFFFFQSNKEMSRGNNYI